MNALQNTHPIHDKDWWVPNLGMKLHPVMPGSFRMGAHGGLLGWLLHLHVEHEKPAHWVTISREFWIGKYPVTQAEYQEIMGKNPSTFYSRGERNPVDCVSWNDSMAFCTKLTTLEQTANRLPAQYQYRLPTEAEWEFAARGGVYSKGYTYGGANDLGEVAWYQKTCNCETGTHPVGQKKANELGLFDISGNVWEWCYDCYDNYPFPPLMNIKDPLGPIRGLHRVRRGGDWCSEAFDCRVARRGAQERRYAETGMGFRVVLAPILPDVEPELTTEEMPARDLKADARHAQKVFITMAEQTRAEWVANLANAGDNGIAPGTVVRGVSLDGRVIEGNALGMTELLIAVTTADGIEWIHETDPATNLPAWIMDNDTGQMVAISPNYAPVPPLTPVVTSAHKKGAEGPTKWLPT